MVQPIPTALALLAVVLILFALWAMAASRYALAGSAFLSASIVIYLRETRLRGE